MKSSNIKLFSQISTHSAFWNSLKGSELKALKSAWTAGLGWGWGLDWVTGATGAMTGDDGCWGLGLGARGLVCWGLGAWVGAWVAGWGLNTGAWGSCWAWGAWGRGLDWGLGRRRLGREGRRNWGSWGMRNWRGLRLGNCGTLGSPACWRSAAWGLLLTGLRLTLEAGFLSNSLSWGNWGRVLSSASGNLSAGPRLSTGLGLDCLMEPDFFFRTVVSRWCGL